MILYMTFWMCLAVHVPQLRTCVGDSVASR